MIRIVALAALLLPMAAGGAPAPRVLIAFASFRDRPLHPRLYFYETDGRGGGRMTGAVEAVDLRSDTHPSLTHDGRLCVFASEQENQNGDTRLWDVSGKREVPAPAGLNTEAPEVGACASGDGRWVAFAARNRQGAPAGWNIFLFDMSGAKAVELPNLNSDEDEHSPAISGDGRFIAFVSNRPAAGAPAGARPSTSRVFLYDRQATAMLPLPGLAASGRDAEPALSGDGRFLAFSSDRPGGAGSRDIYLYDRQTTGLVPLPGLNGIAPDQSPALSASGRFVAFVSERASGMGERDVYLYDRESSSLLPLPGLNSKAEDFDPAVVELP
jgi:TolB protein